jgi:hypothetical protein
VRAFGSARALRAKIALASDAGWRRIQEEFVARSRRELGEAPFETLVAEGGARSFEDGVAAARAGLAPRDHDVEPRTRAAHETAAVPEES